MRRAFDNRPKKFVQAPPNSANSIADQCFCSTHNDDAATSSEEESGSEVEDEPTDISDSESESGSDSEDISTKSNAYNALLESLKRPAEDQPRSKRRKVAHDAEEELVTEDVGSDVDAAVEEEEGAEDEEDKINPEDAEDSDDEDESDPFETHFANPGSDFLKGISAVKSEKKVWEAKKMVIPSIGRCVLTTPAGGAPANTKKTESVKDLKLKQKLIQPFEKHNSTFGTLQKGLGPHIFGYQDVMFSGRTVDNADELRRMYCIHALNHVYKTRDRVLKDNAKLSHGDDDLELRDQGFTRPKVLFILPTRNSCVKVADTLVQLAEPEQKASFITRGQGK